MEYGYSLFLVTVTRQFFCQSCTIFTSLGQTKIPLSATCFDSKECCWTSFIYKNISSGVCIVKQPIEIFQNFFDFPQCGINPGLECTMNDVKAQDPVFMSWCRPVASLSVSTFYLHEQCSHLVQSKFRSFSFRFKSRSIGFLSAVQCPKDANAIY